MVSLLDVVPASRTVDVGNDQQLEVRGLGLADIAYLINRYPEVKALFTGNTTNFSVDELIEKAPGLACDVIVCGVGERANMGDARKAAERLPIDVQFELLHAVIDESFKSAGGLGPFVAKVSSLLGVAVDVDGIKGLGTSSPKRPKA